jgi:hypothetical protein
VNAQAITAPADLVLFSEDTASNERPGDAVVLHPENSASLVPFNLQELVENRYDQMKLTLLARLLHRYGAYAPYSNRAKFVGILLRNER